MQENPRYIDKKAIFSAIIKNVVESNKEIMYTNRVKSIHNIN